MALPKDRVVLITGASRGIGRATAEAFVRDGARVAACARRKIEGLDALVLPCDVRRRDDVVRAVEATVAHYGALHVLINNAGIGVYGALEHLGENELQDLFQTNVYGAIHAIQAALPHLKRSKGQIINISSTLARLTTPYSVAYSMTKHAIHSLSEGLRLELKSSGVHVIEVGPGLTATEFQKSARLVGVDRPAARDNLKGWPAERVAKAILKASHRGCREVWLTWDGKASIYLHDRFPRLTDWGLEKWARSTFGMR